eukprot:8666579-Pyramimonas_sp.AAC.1
MTKQERNVHAMKELHSTAHTADVTKALQLIRAAGRQGRGEGAGGTHVREGATHLVKTGHSGRPRRPARL